MTQSFSFNLVDEPWLPCVQPDGVTVTLNLRDTLTQAHQLQALSGNSPPQTAALHRLLLAVLHRIFGPADYDEWAALWRAEKFDTGRLTAYLDEWRHRFDLFDSERPFYQVAALHLESQWVSIRRLVHELNAAYPLFNHAETDIRDFLTPSEATCAIITAQCFSLCGTSGAFFPQRTPREKKVQAMFVDGAIARGVNFLIQGSSLFETLMLNLIQYPDDQVVAHFNDDRPSWEEDNLGNPERKILRGYLDYLTWQNRGILLRSEVDVSGNVIIRQMRWEPNERIESPPLDSMQHHFKNKKEGYQPLYFSEDKGLWRDSAALFSLYHTDESVTVHYPPATFRWLGELASPDVGYLEKHKLYRCLALGMSSKPGQATVYFYREETIPLPLAYLQDSQLVNKLRDALEYTHEVSRNLRFATQLMGMHLQVQVSDVKAEVKTWQALNQNAKRTINGWVAHTGVERHYWAGLDIPFQFFIINLAKQEREAILKQWSEQLKGSALDAFDQAAHYVGTDGRSFKAVVRGRGYLTYRLNQLIPKEEEMA